jgi:succinyl-diaminopimelate desuccinylase
METASYVLDLAQRLIKIRSIEGNPEGLSDALETVVNELKEFTVESFEKDGVKSALVYAAPERPEKFALIINVHLDVIPGKDSQYEPVIKDGKLFGVGSMDMKANAACAIAVFKAYARNLKSHIGLQITTDEEIGGFKGTKYQIEQGVKTDFVLTTEPTNFDIVNKAKGVLWLTVKATGVTAHGAYPWRGDNAVWKIHDFLGELKSNFPVPSEESWSTTINVSSIRASNKVFNKIPDDCEVDLDIRCIPEEADAILSKIQALAAGLVVTVHANEPALLTQDDDVFVRLLRRSAENELGRTVLCRGAQGSSDARHYKLISAPGVEFGPVGGGIGADGEWVSIESLHSFTNILKDFLKSIDERV